MPVDHTEKAFEAAIEDHLISVSGYAKTDPTKRYELAEGGKP